MDNKTELRDRAFSLGVHGLHAEAASALRELRTLGTPEPGDHNELGANLMALGAGHLDDAIEEFAQASALWAQQGSGDQKVALRNWADALRLLERFSEAEAKCREAIAIDAEYAYGYNSLGLAIRSQGRERYAAAIEQFATAGSLWAKEAAKDQKLALWNWAETLCLLERFSEAETKCREAIGVDAKYADGYNLLGLTLRDQGRNRYDEAIEQFAAASSLWANEGSVHQKIALWHCADTLRLLDRFTEADAKCREAIAVDAKYASAYNLLGLALQGQGRDKYEDAIEQFTNASSLWASEGSNDQTIALANWANTLRLMERFAEAEAKCRQVIAIDDKYAFAYNLLGLALRGQGRDRYQDAIAQFAIASSLSASEGSKDQKVALWNWADTLRLQERFAEAEAKFREAIAIDDKDASAYNSLGLALRGQGRDRYQDAIAQFATAGTLWAGDGSKDQTIALLNWADTLRLQERFAEAEAKFREAIAIDDKYASAYNSLGRALQGQGRDRYQDAIAQFETAGTLWASEGSNDQTIALLNWADTLLLQERFAEAEAKCGEAIAVDDKNASAYELLGRALQGQGHKRYQDAITQFETASALWAGEGSKNQKFAFQSWGLILIELEEYDEAVVMYRRALDADPHYPRAHFLLANALAAAGQYQEALDTYDVAIARDPDDPYNHHNKAYHLFYGGHFESGWWAWRAARRSYEKKFSSDPPVLTLPRQAEQAVNFASVLEEYFADRNGAERLYRAVLATWPDRVDALVGLAKLYFSWAQSERPSPVAVSRLSASLTRATAALESCHSANDPWTYHLKLADLFIETENYVRAQDSLDAAAAWTGHSRQRQAEIASRSGVLHSRRNRAEQAAACFAEALTTLPSDLKLRANLAEALLKQKDFPRAESELRRVLAVAPGHVEALIAHAQLCIELGDAGEVDRYGQAEDALDKAIALGNTTSTGSKRLVGRALADVYYLRGYVRVKRYESDAKFIWALAQANRDFDACAALDTSNFKARSAQRKVRGKLLSTFKDRSLEWVGTVLLCALSALVFAFAQWDFFFPGRTLFGVSLSAASKLKEPGYYVLVTFGALVFLIAGLSLPKLLKLKVGSIELEKGSVDQIKAPVNLNISK